MPDDLFENWVRFQNSRALAGVDDVTTRLYRLYLLALAGRPSIAAMNIALVNDIPGADDTQRWMLAAAYQLAGSDDIALELAGRPGTRVADYRETGGTYGSGLRDSAMILEKLVHLSRREADSLNDRIMERLSSDEWMSTHTAAYCLLAVGKHLQATGAGEGARLSGAIQLPDGRVQPFDTNDVRVDVGL